MKKFFLLFSFLFIVIPSFGSEFKSASLLVDKSYFLLLDEPAISFSITNPNVISIKTVDTYNNSRNQIIVTGIKEGATKFGIVTDKKNYKYNIIIGTSIDKTSDDFVSLDIPPKRGL